MKYINVKFLEKSIRKYADIKHSNGEIATANGILKSLSVLNNVPSEEVIEVVRCNECKRSYNTYLGDKGCEKLSVTGLNPNFYCGDGEREQSNERDII